MIELISVLLLMIVFGHLAITTKDKLNIIFAMISSFLFGARLVLIIIS